MIDLVSGVLAGGHQQELLDALVRLYAEDGEVVTIAPYVNDRPAEPSESLGGLLNSFRSFRTGLRAKQGEDRVLVAHSPTAVDFAAFWLAALVTPGRRRSACVMVIRRDPVAISQHRNKWLGKAFVWFVGRMIRTGRFHLAADSPLVLDSWLRLAPGRTGTVVGVPPLAEPRVGENALELIAPSGPLVGLLGHMREDKGAAHYPEIVESALRAFPDGGLLLQTSADTDVARKATDEIEQRWGDDQRVQAISGHISSDQYAQLAAAPDIYVLPYSPDAYGGGSSGILSDAFAAGGAVVMTRLSWAQDAFADDPRIFWIDDPADSAQIETALRAASGMIGKVEANRDTAAREFADSWRAAADAALAETQKVVPRKALG